MLQNGDETLLAFQAANQFGYGIKSGEGMQRAAVMARGKVGRSRHRQSRRGQHGLGRHSGSVFFERTIDDFSWQRFLDELDQRFYGGIELNTVWHRLASLYRLCFFDGPGMR